MVHKNNNISHQLRIAKGHLEKVISMYDNGDYCIDVVHQSMAVQSALRKIDERVLQYHLETCVVDALKKGQNEKVIAEIVEVLKKR